MQLDKNKNNRIDAENFGRQDEKKQVLKMRKRSKRKEKKWFSGQTKLDKNKKPK